MADAAPSPDAIFDELVAYQRTAALCTAIDLDLFSAIAAGAGSAAELAARCGASERGVRSLCDHLVVRGFLAKGDGRYALEPVAATFLDRAAPAFLGGAAAFLAAPRLRAKFDALADAVRHGGAADGIGSTGPDDPMWVDFARAMEPMMRPAARHIAELVVAMPGELRRVLDVAAGHGRYGIEFARAKGDVEVTAIDWPSVLEVARANAVRDGVGERHHVRPGSAFDVDWGVGHDAVLLINFLHHFDFDGCVALLRKAHAALRPGGRAVVLEAVPDEDRVAPPRPAAFSLLMLATTPRGDAYPRSELDAMWRAAGFSTVSWHPLPESPNTLSIGER